MILGWLKGEWEKFLQGPPPKPVVDPPRSKGFGGMKIGHRHEVIKAFTDYDGIEHPVGESWTFTGENFLPYEDGQSIFIETVSGVRSHIRLQWRPEEQGEVLDNWSRYVRPL